MLGQLQFVVDFKLMQTTSLQLGDYTLLRYARGVTPNLATNCRLKFELLSNPHSVPIDDTGSADSLNIAQACAQRTSLT